VRRRQMMLHVVMLVLWVLMTSVAAEIPGDLRAVANTWAFLAAMGQRCDTRLEVFGYAGLSEEVCLDFEAQYTRVSEEFSATRQSFEDAARAVEASGSQAVKMEWHLFMHDFEASTTQVFKAMQHVIFLKQNELDKRKKPERGKRK
jgi:hypothetical protein